MCQSLGGALGLLILPYYRLMQHFCSFMDFQVYFILFSAVILVLTFYIVPIDL